MNNLIFDFDGVLGDTWEVLVQAHVELGTRSTRNEVVLMLQAYFSELPNHTRNHSLSEQEMGELSELLNNLSKKYQEIGFNLFSDFVREIEMLQNSKIAVVSTASQAHIVPALAVTAINPTHVLGFEDHHSKEDKIESICKDWGVGIKDVYYFTDTLADVYELKDFIAEDKLIGVTWGYCTKAQLLTELAPENLLDVPADIHQVLAR